MIVIHIIPKFTKSIWGGAESMIVDLVRNYPPEIKSEVWTCRTPHDARSEVVDGVRVKRFSALYLFGKHMIGQGKPGIPPGLLAEVLRVARDLEPILLHLHVHNLLSGLALIVGRIRGVKSVLTLHSQVAYLKPTWRYFPSNIFPVKQATRVVAVSEAVANQARKVTEREDIEVIPNGIDFGWLEQGDRERGRGFLKVSQGKETKILLFVGRMARVKNLEVLLEAFAILLRSTNGTCRLALVGPEAEPGYAAFLRKTAQHLGVAGHVIFVGAVPHRSGLLADLYAASDVVVMPSRYEAQSLSVLEAWGAGRPVVVADVGGMGPMVRKWNAGFLWLPDTGPEGLAEVLRQALSGRQTEMGDKIRRAREYYSFRRMVDDYLNLYRAVTAN